MRVVISGGTGLIGQALTRSLTADGHDVVILSRRPRTVVDLPEGAEAVYWDTRSTEEWAHYVDGAGAVVNLAGASVAGESLFNMRWTKARRRAIHNSRVNVGKALVEASKAAAEKPRVLIQASAVGYYGPSDDDLITEAAPAADDFLARVCVDWEKSTKPVERLDVRRAVIRTGIVLSDKGGALPRQMLPFHFFAGGPIGSGEQWMPWIHIDDEVGAIRFLLENDDASGVFNLTAPNPVKNRGFSTALGKAMRRPSAVPVPAFAFELMFGEAASILLTGQRAVPERLQELGYEFKFKEVEAALMDLLR